MPLVACIQQTLHCGSRIEFCLVFFSLYTIQFIDPGMVCFLFFFSSSWDSRDWFYLTWLLIGDLPLTVLFTLHHIKIVEWEEEAWKTGVCFVIWVCVISAHKIIVHDSRSFWNESVNMLMIKHLAIERWHFGSTNKSNRLLKCDVKKKEIHSFGSCIEKSDLFGRKTINRFTKVWHIKLWFFKRDSFLKFRKIKKFFFNKSCCYKLPKCSSMNSKKSLAAAQQVLIISRKLWTTIKWSPRDCHPVQTQMIWTDSQRISHRLFCCNIKLQIDLTLRIMRVKHNRNCSKTTDWVWQIFFEPIFFWSTQFWCHLIDALFTRCNSEL